MVIYADLSIIELPLNVLFSYIWHIYIDVDTVAMHKLSVMGLIELNFLCCRVCTFSGDVRKWT